MSFWDKPKQIARLRELVNEGLTAKQIGDVLSCSRGAVIGQCARLRIVRTTKRELPAPNPTGGRDRERGGRWRRWLPGGRDRHGRAAQDRSEK